MHLNPSVAVGVHGQRGVRGVPTGGAGALEAGAVFRWPPGPARHPRRRWAVKHPIVTVETDQQLHVHIRHRVGHRGSRITRVHHHHRWKAARSTRAPGGAQTSSQLPDLGGGHRHEIIVGIHPDRIHRRHPRRTTPLDARKPRIVPARDRLTVTVTATRRMTVTAIRRALRIRSRAHGHISGEQKRSLVRRGRQPIHQHIPYPGGVDLPGRQRVVQRAMPPPEHRRQRQLHQRGHRPLTAGHRIAELEQRIRPSRQTPVKPIPEPGHSPELDRLAVILHTDHDSPWLIFFFRQKHDHPRAVPMINRGHNNTQRLKPKL